MTLCKEHHESPGVTGNCTSVTNTEMLLSHESDSFKHGTSPTHTGVRCLTATQSCQASIRTRGADNISCNCEGREGSNLAYCVNFRKEGKRETTQVYLSLPPDSSTRTGLHPAFKKGGKFDKLLRSLNRVTVPRN